MWARTLIKHSTGALCISLSAACLIFGPGLAGCSSKVSYQSDIQPILDRRCAECHSEGGLGFAKSGFLVDSYEHVMRGTKYGAIIEPGSSISSTLYRLVAGKTDPSIRMPHGRAPLSKREVESIAAWIDQGAKNN
jgi:hypothetical protein